MATVLTLTKKEEGYVLDILKDKGEIATCVPNDLAPSDILSGIRACVKWLRKADRTSYKLKPVLGRLMILARQNPTVYKEAGYQKYKDFLKTELEDKYGISHSSLYEVRKVMQAFPNLSLEQYGSIPTCSLLLLAKFTDSTKKDHPKLLAKAAELTFDQLREWVVEHGYLGKEDVEPGGTFSVTGSRSAIARIKKFFADERVIAYCESEKPGDILGKMIEEVTVEWLDKGEKRAMESSGEDAA